MLTKINVTATSATTVGAANEGHISFLFETQENAQRAFKRVLWRRISLEFEGERSPCFLLTTV